MKIKNEVIQKLDNTRGYAIIMLALDCSHTAARRYIRENDDNLTKAAMLKAIREEFGLSDSEILEDTEKEVISK